MQEDKALGIKILTPEEAELKHYKDIEARMELDNKQLAQQIKLNDLFLPVIKKEILRLTRNGKADS